MGTYLGQNFLTDTKIRHYLGDKIKKIYEDSGCEILIEIGPGKGSLTKLIHDISPDFFVIERDNKLVDGGKLKVEGLENVSVIHADVLDVDVDMELEKRGKSPQKTLVVGNLPYYITSPILRKFFGEGQQDYVGGVFMVQKEVADKLRTDATKKSYLWRIINFAYDVIYLKTVPAKAFSPAPKVTSALIELRKKVIANEMKQSTGGSDTLVANLDCHVPAVAGPRNDGLLLSTYNDNGLDFEKFQRFLDDFAPFSRKTLASIATMLKKKRGKDRIIPEKFKGNRLEELGWEAVGEILR